VRGRELETESVCWLKHKDMGMECAWERVDRISVRREWVKRETDGWERRWREGRKREMWVFSLVMRETYKRARGIRNKWEREAESRREFDGMLREDGLEKEREKGALAGVYSLRGIPPNRGGAIFGIGRSSCNYPLAGDEASACQAQRVGVGAVRAHRFSKATDGFPATSDGFPASLHH